MKYIILFLSFFVFLSGAYGENVSVELTPNNISKYVGDTFNLDLIVKNVPKNATCSGFETCINYNPSILNLTNIKLSDISNNTTLKATNVSSGKISLAWFSNPPYGNFTVATLSFKALNEGSGNISLRKTVISNADGYRIEPLIIKNSSITINPLKQTIGKIIINNFTYNKNIKAIVHIDGVKPIHNISGNITFTNVNIKGNPTVLIPFNSTTLKTFNNTISFFIIPKNVSKYIDLLELPINITNTNYNITLNIYANGKKINKTSVEIITTTNKYIGFATENSLGKVIEKTNITFGSSKEIMLKVFNSDENLTNFSGYIFINNSLFDVSNCGISIFSNIRNKINTLNMTFNNSHLYFNISLTNGTNGTFSILKFNITPKLNENIFSTIYVGNLSLYSNSTKIYFPVKNLTVGIIKREANNPPKLKIAYGIINNKEVHFYALAYDKDGDKLKYIWDFGDGKNSTEENPIHTYSNYTIYKIKCTVKDSLNGTDKVEGIIPVKNINPVNYSISNDSFILNKNENKTVYLNITLKNPLIHKVDGYLNFLDYNNYHLLKIQYKVVLKPNETKNLIIPINVSKSCELNWNVVYYPAIKNNKAIDFINYEWDFEKKIIFKSKPKIKINKYRKVIDLNNTQVVVLKVNKVKTIKNYVINKTIIPNNDKIVPYYSFASIFGFVLGILLIRFKIK